MSRATPVSPNNTPAAASTVGAVSIEQIDVHPMQPDQSTSAQLIPSATHTTSAATLPPRMQTLPVREFLLQSIQDLTKQIEVLATHTSPAIRDQAVEDSDTVVSRNITYSLEALKEAAWSGDVIAQFELGNRFYLGSYVEKSFNKAFEMFYMAALQGSAESQFNVGVMYELGQGTPKDDVLAAHWFRQAANQGNTQAQSNLGMMYNLGDGVEQNDEKAVLWDSKAAEKGHAESQFNLAYMYQEGRGVQQSDTYAVHWYRKSADQGFAKAQCNLGVMYDKGEGIEQDESKAVILYTKAAANNNKDAQFNLVENYINGQGVKKDLMQATYFLLKFGITSSGRCVELIDFVFLLDFFPLALNHFHEFKNVKKIIFRVPDLKKNDFISIARFIRENTRIEEILFHGGNSIKESDILILSDAISFNTVLTELHFNSSFVSTNTKTKIADLLTKNTEIMELRDYMKNHPIFRSDVLPLEVLALTVDQIIIACLKSGQSKKQTTDAIEEFLGCVSANSNKFDKAIDAKA
jgi:TPR repeat protein